MKFYLSILFLLGINLFSSAKPQRLKHVVTITFTANASDAQIKEIDDSFQGLTKIPVVKGYEWGTAVNQKDATLRQHVYAFTFDQASDLEVYAKSKEHQAHIKVGAKITAGVSAIDYLINE
jgi:hypothetical protein